MSDGVLNLPQAQIFELRSRLVSVAKRVIRHHQDAEDIADEAITRYVSLLREGGAVDEAAAWLHRTTLNLAIDRARQWVRRHQAAEPVEEVHSPEGGPRDRAQRGEMRDIVWREILELPERQQQVLTLHTMEGHSYEEVGRLLGITGSTARAHAQAAREELRRRLSRYRD